MTRSLSGPTPLVCQLHAWTPADADAAGGDVAERLAAWVAPLDAIRLQSVHQALDATPAPSRSSRRPLALDEDVQRTRGVLAAAIAKDPLALAGVKATDNEDPGHGPWQQRHIELQRQMGQMVGALRDHLRQAAARTSPSLKELATLDATFEQLLATREQALLPTLPSHLERRWRELRAAHLQACEAAGQPDDPARWREPGGWLHTFAQDWRQALLAELDFRLEPVLGLLEAVRHDTGFPT